MSNLVEIGLVLAVLGLVLQLIMNMHKKQDDREILRGAMQIAYKDGIQHYRETFEIAREDFEKHREFRRRKGQKDEHVEE